MKKILLVVCLFLTFSLASCTNPKGEENDKIPHEDENKTYKVDFYVEDFLLHKEELKTTNDILKYTYINFSGITNRTVHEKCLAILAGKTKDPTSIIFEIEWYDGTTLVDQNYKLEKDTRLSAKVVTKLGYSRTLEGISNIIETTKDHVTYPNEIYQVLYDEEQNVTKFNSTKTLVKLGDHVKGQTPAVGLLPSEDSNNKCFNFKGSKITIYAESLDNGLLEKFFASNQYIKEIEIIGDVKNIDRNAFFDLDNLEKIIITGNVEEIKDYAFSYLTFLKEVKITGNVTKLSEKAFYNCGINVITK